MAKSSEDRQTVDPMVDSKAAIREFGERLERDYADRVHRYARGLDVWGNGTTVGYDIPLGGRVGSSDGGIARYARRTGFLGLFGRRIRVRDLADIERQFRREIDEWLVEQERKQAGPSGSS